MKPKKFVPMGRLWAHVQQGKGGGGAKGIYVLADMHHNGKQLIQPIRVLCVIRRIWQSQLEGEGNTVKELGIPSEGFLVFEAFQV